MASQPTANRIIEPRETIDAAQPRPASQSYMVGLRMKFGDEFPALDIHADGITFRTPANIQPGKVVELILCNGSILVDAIVIQCLPVRDDEGGFAIRARYHHASEALASLIFAEIQRVTGGTFAG